MRRVKKTDAAAGVADPRKSLISMIDYLIPEAKEAEPMAEYFLRMARASLADSDRDAPEPRTVS